MDDKDIRESLRINVIKRDGTVSSINTPSLHVATKGAVTLLEDRGTYTLTTEGAEDMYYKQKLDALLGIGPMSGPYGEVVGDSWEFSTSSRYLSGIAGGLPSAEGAFSISTGKCSSIEYPGEHAISISDVCGPCLDCGEIYTLEAYVKRLDDVFHYFTKLLGATNTSIGTDILEGRAEDTYRGALLRAYAYMEVWNSLVHKDSIKLSVSSYGSTASIAFSYRNVTTAAQGPVDASLEVSFSQLDGSPWNGLSEGTTTLVMSRSGETFELQSESPSSSKLTSSWVINTLASGITATGDIGIRFKGTSITDIPVINMVARLSLTGTHFSGPKVVTESISIRVDTEDGDE